jgi:phosphate transport system substrate-binding protein
MGAILIGLALTVAGLSIWGRLHPKAPYDATANINVSLTRPDGWRKIVDKPVVAEGDMAMISGSTATIPITAELFRQFYDYSDDQVRESKTIWHSTTDIAYEELVERRPRDPFADGSASQTPVSLILVTPPSPAEQKMGSDKGVEFHLTPVALDGFVFITHRDNPIDSLSLDQIRGVYSGVITNWSQLGGLDAPITAYQREAGSGSQTAMETLVMDGMAMVEPVATKVYGMGGLVRQVSEYQNGPSSIGYTYNYYINNLYRSNDIKVITIDGIPPTDENLISRRYPLTTSYYAVTRADEPADSPASTLRDFLAGPTGQEVIELAGYCKVGSR